jgi:YHYH protein
MKLNQLFIILFSGTITFSCGNDDGDTDGMTTNAELPSVFANFTDNVNAYVDGDFIVIETDDVPNHSSPYFNSTDSRYEAYNGDNTNFRLNPNRISSQNIVFRIPINPTEATSKSATGLGPIGVSLNGVVFFNQYAGPNQPLTNEIDSFDQYLGHPQMSGQYHYHQEPTYLTSTIGSDGLLGWLMDGFPVYGPVENEARVLNANLDDYHGHSHATDEYPEGIYHYHITDNDPYINGSGYFGTPGTVSQ